MMTDAALAALLKPARRIAVLGYSTNPGRASHRVSSYMASAGHRVIGVNPLAATAEAPPGIAAIVPTLSAAYETFALTTPRVATAGESVEPAIEIVDVFRNPDALPGIVDEVLGLPARPKLVFLQEGVTHAASEARLAEAGIAVVADRCILKEHQRLVAFAGPTSGL